MERKSNLLVEPGLVLHQFSETDTEELVRGWLSVYGANRHGVNAKDYLWHIFSADRYPSMMGAAALIEYQQQVAVEFVVLSNDRQTAFTTDRLPVKAGFSDYYVFPRNLAWTMAFTHEDGWLGPYFAMHANYQQLRQSNLLQLRKQEEAEIAKSKGWR